MIDLNKATEMLTLYLKAESDLLAGKTISFNGRTVSRENLSEIRQGRKEWEQKFAQLTQSQLGYKRSRFKVARF